MKYLILALLLISVTTVSPSSDVIFSEHFADPTVMTYMNSNDPKQLVALTSKTTAGQRLIWFAIPFQDAFESNDAIDHQDFLIVDPTQMRVIGMLA